jgi:hypothetical protein
MDVVRGDPLIQGWDLIQGGDPLIQGGDPLIQGGDPSSRAVVTDCN